MTLYAKPSRPPCPNCSCYDDPYDQEWGCDDERSECECPLDSDAYIGVNTLVLQRYAAPGEALRVVEAYQALNKNGRYPFVGTLRLVISKDVSEAVKKILREGLPADRVKIEEVRL